MIGLKLSFHVQWSGLCARNGNSNVEFTALWSVSCGVRRWRFSRGLIPFFPLKLENSRKLVYFSGFRPFIRCSYASRKRDGVDLWLRKARVVDATKTHFCFVLALLIKFLIQWEWDMRWCVENSSTRSSHLHWLPFCTLDFQYNRPFPLFIPLTICFLSFLSDS